VADIKAVAAVVVDIKAAVAAGPTAAVAADGINLWLLIPTADCTKSGGAYQLRRFSFVEAFLGAWCADECRRAGCLAG
jgi:hypothetical protein